MNHRLDSLAKRMFLVAIETDRCGELLECLFDGGSATVDPAGQLILVDAETLRQLGRERPNG